ncbi:MAG: lipopolysaccharide assembly protein LapA domain-containing protein [Acidimicrobiia bacterium]
MMEKDELHEHLGTAKGPAKPRDIGKIIRLSLSGIATLLLIIFAVTNSDPVEVNLVVWSGEIRLIFVIIGSAILGAIGFGVFRSVLGRRRRNRRA